MKVIIHPAPTVKNTILSFLVVGGFVALNNAGELFPKLDQRTRRIMNLIGTQGILFTSLVGASYLLRDIQKYFGAVEKVVPPYGWEIHETWGSIRKN